MVKFVKFHALYEGRGKNNVKEMNAMSEDMDKICRTILYQVKMAKTLEEAIDAIEVIAGPENVAVVNDKIAQKHSK